jgi:putative transposase
LLEPRRRAERALVSVVCQTYVEGVSTRRVDDLVRSMGIDAMSKSEVSELAKNLDTRVAEFRNRPLDAGPYTYMWVDALFHKVREGGRVVSVARADRLTSVAKCNRIRAFGPTTIQRQPKIQPDCNLSGSS